MTRAVIFDLDGTLIDSAPDIHAAANKVMVQNGFAPFTLAEARGFVGHGAAIFIERCMAARGHEDDSLKMQMLAEFLELYEGAVHLTHPYPNVVSCLGRLAKTRWRLAICTNKPEGPTHAVLRHLSLLDRFDVVIGGDSLEVRKPDPRPLQETVRRLGVDRAIFVGDSEVDAETAKRAHLPFALYSKGYRKTPVEDLCHSAVFDDFAQLPGILDSLLP